MRFSSSEYFSIYLSKLGASNVAKWTLRSVTSTGSSASSMVLLGWYGFTLMFSERCTSIILTFLFVKSSTVVTIDGNYGLEKHLSFTLQGLISPEHHCCLPTSSSLKIELSLGDIVCVHRETKTTTWVFESASMCGAHSRF